MITLRYFSLRIFAQIHLLFLNISIKLTSNLENPLPNSFLTIAINNNLLAWNIQKLQANIYLTKPTF